MVVAVALAALIGALAATAGAQWQAWNPDSEPEPDTGIASEGLGDYDAFQKQQNAQNPANHAKIYFDAIVDKEPFPFVTSPNAHEPGVVDTDVRNVVTSYFHALFGYWKDCNGDGFIGNADTGQTHYLPATSSGLQTCAASGPFFDGTHVTEYLAIGPRATEPPFGHPSFVQDHFAKVWHDWGLPGDGPTEPRLLFPFPKGTFADSNGQFQYVDWLAFGRLSGTGQAGSCVQANVCALWPAGQSNTDGGHAEPRQCYDGAAPGDGYWSPGPATIRSHVLNVLDGTTDSLGSTSFCSGSTTSPVPNVHQVDLGVLQVNYPTNVTKERYNSSDQSDQQGATITEPVGCNPGSGTGPFNALTLNATGWASNPSAALQGWNGNPGTADDYVQSYLAGSNGPSVIPTVDEIWGPAVYELSQNPVGSQVFTANECHAASQPAPNTLILQDTPPVPEKTDVDTTFSFFQDTHSAQAGTQVCVPTDSALFTHANKCQGTWYSDSNWLHSNGLTSLNASGPLGSFEASFYADTSGGPASLSGFSQALDDFNGLSSANLYSAASTLVNGLWDSPFGNPGDHTPAGVANGTTELNYHVYGDWACSDPIQGINGDTSDPGHGHNELPQTATGWSCDRDDWVAALGISTNPAFWTSGDILEVWNTGIVGDFYDARDLECQDNDIQVLNTRQSTTDSSGPAGAAGGTDCENIAPGRIPASP